MQHHGVIDADHADHAGLTDHRVQSLPLELEYPE
jgi:hypothetical protein